MAERDARGRLEGPEEKKSLTFSPPLPLAEPSHKNKRDLYT